MSMLQKPITSEKIDSLTDKELLVFNQIIKPDLLSVYCKNSVTLETRKQG
jgi:hypothetical protein